MMNIGILGLILIFIIALIVFESSKLPQLGRAIGDTLRDFKMSTRYLVLEPLPRKLLTRLK